MPVIDIPFRSRGPYLVALIALKGHPKRVRHYSKTSGQEHSWAMRDYLTGQIVRSGRSKMGASQVEDLVEYAEEPPACPVELVDFWKAQCQAASERHFGAGDIDFTTPNPQTLGKWKRMTGSCDL